MKPQYNIRNNKAFLSSGIMFTFHTQKQQLTIQATIQKDKLRFVGQMAASPYVDFDLIKQMIEQDQFNILIKNNNILKIKVGPVILQLNEKPKTYVQLMQEMIEKLVEQKLLIQKQIQQLKYQCQMMKSKEENKKLLNQKNKQVVKLKYTITPNIQSLLNFNNKPYNQTHHLKSNGISVDKNIITRTSQFTTQNDFYLLDIPLTQQLKIKKSWTIKINKLVCGIYLGICLKSQMQKNKFNDKLVNYDFIGHGLYLIGSFGWSFSHSQQDHNCTDKDFAFDEGDVILCEYDPIGLCLNFTKNNIISFEMSIIAPRKNDSYHPCVSLSGEGQSVQMILLR